MKSQKSRINSRECDECALGSEHWEMQLAHSDSDVLTVKPDVCY